MQLKARPLVPLLLGLIVFTSAVRATAPRGPATTLREAAGPPLLIGCSAEARDVTDPKVSALMAREYSCLTRPSSPK